MGSGFSPAKCSTAVMPSAEATCANQGGPATSPMAYTLERLVSIYSFTFIQPSSTVMLQSSSPRFSIFPCTPTAMSALSASIISPLFRCTFIFDLFFSIFSTMVLVKMFILRFLKSFSSSVDISSSSTGNILGSASMIVTSVPKV